MYLKKLCVEGFKSIANYIEVDFINDVNVIMGPNGSGKSNVFECIQWVLGGMSAKQLRAGSMEEVIFDGGANGKPSNYAQATLIFDNTDRGFDLDVDEVAVTRKLTRGKGNEYFVNNEPTKLKDLTALFMNKGIGKNNYAITGQNRITEFIMMKPTEIQSVIEDAAGISGFKAKKGELTNSIANYERDIDGINTLIDEMARNIKPLEKQIKNAQIYAATKKELDEKKLFYYSTKESEIEKQIEENRLSYNSLVTSKKSNLKEKIEIESSLSNYSETYTVDSKSLEETEKEKDELEELVSELTKDKIMMKNNLDNLLEKKESMLKNIQNLEEASHVEETEKNTLFETINSLGREIKICEADIKKNEILLSSTRERIKDIEEFLEKSSDNITKTIVEIEKKENDKTLLLERINNKNETALIKKRESKSVSSEIKALNLKVKDNENKIDDIVKRIDVFADLEKQIKALDNIINSSKKSEGRKKRTLDIARLFRNISGFHGVLFEIVSYDDKYVNAMDALYGGVLHNFVVQDSKVANKCVEVLKKNKIPPANFVIIDKIKSGKPKSAIELEGVKKVSDILKYDNRYDLLVTDYFGNTYIADNSDIAENAWNSTNQKYRVCTLDGILYSSNTIRGGYIQKDANKLKKEYDDLLIKKKRLLNLDGEEYNNTYELKGSIGLLKKENSSIVSQIEAISQKEAKIKAELLSCEQEVDSLKNSLESISININDLEAEKDSLEKEVKDKQNSLIENKSILENFMANREKLLLNKSKNETLLEEHEKNYYVYRNSSREKIESLQGDIDVVQDQIEFAKEKLSEVESKFNEFNDRLKLVIENWNKLRIKMENNRIEKDSQSERLNTIVEDISNIENKITKLSFAYEKLEQEMLACENAVSDVPEDTMFMVYNESMDNILSQIEKLGRKIKSLGFINTDAIGEYNELKGRYDVMVKNKQDIEESKRKILNILQTMQDDMVTKYLNCFETLNKDYSEIFTKLFNGGAAELIMDDPSLPLDSGVTIKATPPGKKNKPLSLLSGGEKSLAAVSFIFALLKYSPSPVVIFDEIDAAMDEINVSLISDYINSNKNVQYVIVSHRKPMMKIAKALYGASMNKGVTELISQKLTSK